MTKPIRGIDYSVHNVKHVQIEYPLVARFVVTREDTVIHYRSLLTELIQGKKVVEIGAASTPQEVLFQFNPLEYICVEPTPRRIVGEVPSFFRYADNGDFFEGYDGVTYLEENREQVSVISSGVYDSDILVGEDYRKRLTELIYDRTPKNG